MSRTTKTHRDTDRGRLTLSFRTSLLGLVLATLALPAMSARPQERPKPQAENGSSKADEAVKAEKKTEDRYLAIIGGTVHTMAGAVLDRVAVLAKNGKIVEIGSDLVIPEAAEKVDATGYQVYPGLIALRSSNVLGSGNPEDSTNVYDLSLELALAGGLTTGVAGNTAAKLTRGTVEDMVVKRSLFETINYSSRNPSSRRDLRHSLERVRQHLRELEEYEEKKRTDPQAEKPDEKWIRGDYARAMRLIKHEAVAQSTADGAQEIRELCALASRYDLRVVIQGAEEGWTVADEMGRAGVSAVVSPRARSDPSESTNRATGSTIQNARILYEHGVPIAITPRSGFISTGGMGGRDLQHVPLEAAYAVRGGLPDDAAIAAITIGAARILGVDHRVGSIEVGKDADFVITDGPLLHYQTHARWTIVNGRIAYDQQKDTLFDHLHPESKPGAPPPRDHWPRSLGEDW